MRALRLLALLQLCGGTSLMAQSPARDSSGVRRAALVYLEGFYEGDSTKLMRCVRSDVLKYGFARGRIAAEFSDSRLAWSEFLDFAREVKASGRTRPATDPKEVEILDVLDQTAAVKVRAYWGSDYLLMARFDGRWMITQVLWQTPARE
jgi:hypothetical protein